jgi:hypothetical protein
VSRASAAVASRAFGTVEEAAAMYRPIRTAVAKAFEGVDLSGDAWLEDGTARLASLSDTLPDAVRKMDWTAFTEALRRAQVGAAVAGYTAPLA